MVVATSVLIAFRLITRAAASLEVPPRFPAPHHLNPTALNRSQLRHPTRCTVGDLPTAAAIDALIATRRFVFVAGLGAGGAHRVGGDSRGAELGTCRSH